MAFSINLKKDIKALTIKKDYTELEIEAQLEDLVEEEIKKQEDVNNN